MKQVTDTSKAILWWDKIHNDVKLQLLIEHIEGWDNEPINTATDEDIERVYMRVHGLYDTFIAVFNCHIGDALNKAKKEFKEKYSALVYKKEIEGFVENGIMAIFNQKPNVYTQYFADTITKFVNEEKMNEYLSENPQPTDTGDTVSSEVGLKLWVTGSGDRASLTDNDVLLRTDDATIHLSKDSEFGKLAHAMIDRYNNHDALVGLLGWFVEHCQTYFPHFPLPNSHEEEKLKAAKELLNNIKVTK